MKIAYCIRKNWKSAHGGDVVQMLNTKREVENEYDVNIRIIDNIHDLQNFKPDIVHIFNMQTIEESSKYLQEAKQLNAKTILSTIYWDMSHARFIVNFAKLGIFNTGENYRKIYNLYNGFEAIIASVLGKPISATRSYKEGVRLFLDDFDWYLPNSEEEMKIVNKIFNTKYENYTVVPNSVDFERFPFLSNSNRNGFISAARIEPIKNQLQLVEICKNEKYDLTLVGGVTPNNLNYLKAVRKKASGLSNIQIISENINQNQLNSMFNSHRVHVLASFRESPGLSSLEALGSGMNIVISESDFCPTDTYFKSLINKHAFICDPYSKKSINIALNNANLAKIPVRNLIGEFNWKNTARKTFESYLNVLNK
ncbi:glycosyltransferase [Acinetobacter junii]|uniref:glycosyltransferase n=1 Tax=Acinetobacter junii TaxID=40215 RepID=UPI00124D175C|nr:glycosyltransferase [Acinetobacter junii]